MVQSIQKNIKNQTRRTQGLEIPNQNPDGYEYLGRDHDTALFRSPEGKLRECKPKFRKNDILWVRETLYQNGELGLLYSADNKHIEEQNIPNDFKPKIDKQGNYRSCKIPNIFMPKFAARTFLKVIDVDCERLSDISDEDARSEGIEIIPDYYWTEAALNYMYGEDDRSYRREYFFLDGNYGIGSGALANHNGLVASFLTLFAKVTSWDFVEKNPWVFVYRFEKIEKPENFYNDTEPNQN